MGESRNSRSDLLRGTLETLILKTVARGPLHGYGIARFLEQATEDTLRIEEGSLYPALYRLEKRALVASEWGKSELGRRAKYYRLTEAGAEQLRSETEDWLRFSAAVSRILLPEPHGQGAAS